MLASSLHEGWQGEASALPVQTLVGPGGQSRARSRCPAVGQDHVHDAGGQVDQWQVVDTPVSRATDVRGGHAQGFQGRLDHQGLMPHLRVAP